MGSLQTKMRIHTSEGSEETQSVISCVVEGKQANHIKLIVKKEFQLYIILNIVNIYIPAYFRSKPVNHFLRGKKEAASGFNHFLRGGRAGVNHFLRGRKAEGVNHFLRGRKSAVNHFLRGKKSASDVSNQNYILQKKLSKFCDE